MATRRRRRYAELSGDWRCSDCSTGTSDVDPNYRARSVPTARRCSPDAAAAADSGFGQSADEGTPPPALTHLRTPVVSVDRASSDALRLDAVGRPIGKPVAGFVLDSLERRTSSSVSVRKPEVADDDDDDGVQAFGTVDFRRENALHDSDWKTTRGESTPAADSGLGFGRISCNVRVIEPRDRDDNDDVIAEQSLHVTGIVGDDLRLAWVLSTLERSLVAHCLTVKKRMRRDRNLNDDRIVGGGRRGRTKIGCRRVWRRGAAARSGGIDLQPGPANEPFRADKVSQYTAFNNAQTRASIPSI